MKPAAWTRAGSLAALITAAIALTACTGPTTSGQGSPAATSGPPVQSSSVTPSGTPTSATSSASASATPTASLITKITGTGTLAGTYQMSLWAHDVITDCGAHAYGQPIIAYFAAHPCRSATRRLWTTPINGKTLALSVVSVSAEVTKVNENPDFSAAQTLVDLENADNTGSVNDLMREGKRIPGSGSSIPPTEVFSVISQDGLVVIMDGWYLTGTTSSKDQKLLDIESDLSFSDASAPDA